MTPELFMHSHPERAAHGLNGKPNAGGNRAQGGSRSSIPQETREEIEERFKIGESNEKIAEALGLKAVTVKRWRSKWGHCDKRQIGGAQ